LLKGANAPFKPIPTTSGIEWIKEFIKKNIILYDYII